MTPPAGRVVEIRAGKSGGTGYAVGPDLVLTAAHVVAAAPDVEVRPATAPDLAVPAKVIWHDRTLDAALLRVPTAYWVGLTTGWAEAAPGRGLACRAVGFARAARQDGGLRVEEAVHGLVDADGGGRAGHYLINVDTSAPVPTGPGTSPWVGMSGAAVLAADSSRLLGMIVLEPPNFPASRLAAIPAWRLLADPGFAALVGAGPEHLVTLPPHPFLRPLRVPPRRQLADPLLLMPAYGVVPFLGRDELVERLLAWAGSDEPIGVAVVTGAGGSGKTRLAARIGERLRADGWDTGQLDPAAELDLDGLTMPTVAVLDYAERAAPTALRTVLQRLAARPDAPSVRLVLLARHTGQWWDLVRPLVRRFAAGKPLIVDLDEHGLDDAGRRLHAVAAGRAFADRLGLPTPPDDPDWVASPELDSPLLVHLAALLTVRGEAIDAGAGDVRTQLLDALLGRERDRWLAALPQHRLDLHQQTADLAVLAATLGGDKLLDVLPELAGDARLPMRINVGRWLADTFPGGGGLAGHGPDLLAEHLLREATDAEPDGARLRQIGTALLGHPAIGPAAAGHLLNTVRLAAERTEAVRAILTDLLAEHLPRLTERAAAEKDEALAGAILAAVAVAAADRLATAAGAAAGFLDEAGDAFDLLAVVLLELHLPALRQESDESAPARLADRLARLGSHRKKLGRYESAMTAVEEVVTIRRGLAEAAPEHLPGLADALAALGMLHRNLDQHGRAPAPVAEAVTILRRLAEADPAAYRSRLATVLANYAVAVRSQGRVGEAMAVTEEAIAMYRELAADDPAPFRRSMVHALLNLGRGHVETRQSDRALELAEEAMAIHRSSADAPPMDLVRLADLYRTAGRPDLALSAGSEAVELCRTGDRGELARALLAVARGNAALDRRDAAVAAATEAVEILRDLARADPDRHRDQLAAGLRTQVGLLVDSGDPASALEPAGEYVQMFAELVGAGLGQFRERYANALDLLGQICSDLEYRKLALQATAKAAEVCRELAAEDPLSRREALAVIVGNLGAHSMLLGRYAEGIEAARESVEIFRILAADAPGQHLENLAGALSNLGHFHDRIGEFDEARQLTGEALAIYRRLPNSIGAVTAACNLARQQGRAGDADAALQAAELAVEAARARASASPSRPANDLAESLICLAAAQDGVGRADLATTSAAEAATVLRGLPGPRLRRLRQLAECVDDLSRYAAAAGDHSGALTAAVEVCKCLSEVAGTDFLQGGTEVTTHIPRYLAAIETVAEHYAAAGQPRPAVRWQRRVVRINALLARSGPATYGWRLGRSLEDLAGFLRAAGRPEFAAVAEAIAAGRNEATPYRAVPSALAGPRRDLGYDPAVADPRRDQELKDLAAALMSGLLAREGDQAGMSFAVIWQGEDLPVSVMSKTWPIPRQAEVYGGGTMVKVTLP